MSIEILNFSLKTAIFIKKTAETTPKFSRLTKLNINIKINIYIFTNVYLLTKDKLRGVSFAKPKGDYA